MGKMDGGLWGGICPSRILLEKEKSGSALAQEQTVILDDCISVSWRETCAIRLKFSSSSGGFDCPFPMSNLFTVSNLFAG